MTNTPWLINKPVTWKISRIRNIAKLSPGYSKKKPQNDELCTIVPMEMLSEKGEIDYSIQEFFENIQQGLTLFQNGDVIFAKITPCMENGKGALILDLPTRYGFGSTEFHVMRPRHEIVPKFLYYYSIDTVFRQFAAENMVGAAGQKRVSSRLLKDTQMFLPPIDEQHLIVEYLDARCATINSAIVSKEKQFDILNNVQRSIIRQAVTKGLNPSVELVATDIDWIPYKPKHWRIQRIKDVLEFYNTQRIPLSAADRGMMTERTYDYYGASGVIDKVEDYIFDGTYILIAEDGANLLSRSKPLAFLASGKFWVNNHAHILKPKWKRDINFFVNLLEVQDYSLFVTGAAQPKLTMENLGKFKIAVPPEQEQREISKFLKIKRDEFYSLSSQLEKQIHILIEYRKSLIHECVIGKRRINKEEVNQIKAYGKA